MTTGESVMEYLGHEEQIQAVAATQSSIFSCDSGKETRQFDRELGYCHRVLRTETPTDLCICEGYLLVATTAGTVHREWAWELPWNRTTHAGFPLAYRRHVWSIVVSLSLSEFTRWLDLLEPLMFCLEGIEATGRIGPLTD